MDPGRETDAAVIRASVGDPHRFGVIFDRHAGTIHGYLARRVGADLADDLVAETFLTAFHRRQDYDTERPSARPWLYGIAANKLLRHGRGERRHLRMLRALGPEPDTEGPGAAALDRVAAVRARRDLLAALDGLPAGEREVLLLFAWEQPGYAEIAEALAIPLGTVRSRLSRARVAVRSAPGANPLDDHDEELNRHG